MLEKSLDLKYRILRVLNHHREYKQDKRIKAGLAIFHQERKLKQWAFSLFRNQAVVLVNKHKL